MTNEEQFEIACKKFDLMIPMLEEEYCLGLNILFSKEMEKLKERDLDQFNYQLTACYMKLKFFPSEKIYQRLIELGLLKRQLQWFVPILEIKKEFETINSSKTILILPFDAFIVIQIHLIFKIMNEVYLWSGKSGKRGSGKNYNELQA